MKNKYLNINCKKHLSNINIKYNELMLKYNNNQELRLLEEENQYGT